MSSDPSDIDSLVRASLDRLRRHDPAPGDEEHLVRVFTAWEREYRTALTSLRRADQERDRASIDEEETPSALRLRVAEYRGRRDGFVKALALALGHEVAARVEAAARRRLEDGEE